MEDPSYVIGMAASAGSLDPVRAVLNNISQDSGVSVILIRHVVADAPSRAADVFASETDLIVETVSERTILRAGRLYLRNPGDVLEVVDGALVARPPKEKERRQPATVLLKSMARALGDRAIGVVLSGRGYDGTEGLIEIHQNGGLTICQAPSTAEYPDMPECALKTGVINAALAPEEIGPFINQFVDDPFLVVEKLHQDLDSGTSATMEIHRLLLDRFGVNLDAYKTTTVSRRILRRIRSLSLDSLKAYVGCLKESPGELDLLFRDLLVGVTTFFRDEDVFQSLKSQAIRPFVEAQNAGEIRAWVSGCSTGEEAYSLAIAFEEAIAETGSNARYRIFATDLNPKAIAAASAGTYSKSVVEASQKWERLKPYFIELDDDQIRIKRRIRENVVFTTHNLLASPPFTKMDLVCCRNVLIYLKQEHQRRAMASMLFGLKKGGYLLLGSNESPGDLVRHFECLDSKARLYRKKSGQRIPTPFRSGILPPMGYVSGAPQPSPRSPQPLDVSVFEAMLKGLVEDGILLNPNKDVLHVFGLGRNLITQFPEGRLESNILRLLAPNLRVIVATALSKVQETAEPVVYDPIELLVDGVEKSFRLEIRSLCGEEGHRYIGILLSHSMSTGYKPANPPLDIDAKAQEMIIGLEKDLEASRESLQTTIEQLEMTNEELQSTNEELLASNEELQSTNEELQSVNDELQKVNRDHQRKIAELIELNNDVDNLLQATAVATIFVNETLQIRRYTAGTTRVFNIIPTDVGRPLGHVTHSLEFPNLIEKVEAVIKGHGEFEEEAPDKNGNWFQLRILPYFDDGTVTGAVITINNINKVKAAQLQLQENRQLLHAANERYDLVLRGASVGIWDWSDVSRGEIYLAPGLEKMFGYAHGEIVGTVDNLIGFVHEEDRARVMQALKAHLEERYRFDVEFRLLCKSGEFRFTRATGQAVWDEEGRPVRMAGSVADIHPRKTAENALAREQLKLIHAARMANIGVMAAGIAHEINNPLTVIKGQSALITRTLESSTPNTSAIEKANFWIDQTVDRISAIIKGLRNFSRDERGMEEVEIPFGRILDETLDFCRSRLKSYGTEIRLEEVERDARLRCHPVQISQVLLNLLMNAGDATKDEPEPWVEIRAVTREGRLWIEVIDNGPGFALDPESAFEPFSTTKPKGKGTGLGLSLSRQIVEDHGGTIGVVTEARHTTLRVILPVLGSP